MFERLDTPMDLFAFRLGSLLSAEQDSLEMLQSLEQAATAPQHQELFREHAEETRQQIENVRRCFELLGLEVDDSPSPTTKGLAHEATSTMRKTAPGLADDVALSGGLETEHYEIAVYTTLITMAQAQGAADVVELLQANLAQERAAADKLSAAAEALAKARAAA